ncbi:MAG: GAF domain-containing protein [Oscillochloridaceae bacterium umkhey_bin13]
MDATKRLFSMKDACHYLGVSRMTLIEAEERGLIQPERTPGGHRRYSLAALRELLQTTQGRHAAVPPPLAPQAVPPHGALTNERPDCVTSSDHALKAALRNLVLLLQVEMGMLYLGDPTGPLQLQASFGVPHWCLPAMSRLDTSGISATVLTTQQPQLYDRHAAHQLPAQLGIGQGLCAPLHYQEQILGCVHVIARQPRQFFPGELSLVNTMATHLASLVINQRLQGQIQAHLALLDQLRTALVAVSPNLEILVWNQALAHLCAIPREQMLGRNPYSVAPTLTPLWSALAQTCADGNERNGTLHRDAGSGLVWRTWCATFRLPNAPSLAAIAELHPL